MLVNRLLEHDERLVASISTTTREARPNEIHGIDYFFATKDEFLRLEGSGKFLEHATVFGERYGTTKDQVEERLEQGFDVLFDIDWQGSRSIKRVYTNSTSIFVVPPSLEILKQRLVDRGEDSDEVIAYRMSQAASEMSHYNEFDYVIVNDDADVAFSLLCEAIEASRESRTVELPDVSQIVESMLRNPVDGS